MGEWQPIETAPKDGRLVLLYYHEWLGEEDYVTAGHWDIDEPNQLIEATWVHAEGYGDADHWMPLPEPPVK